MKTTQLSVSTKKGEAQSLRFMIVQEIPYPDIDGTGSRLQWRNGGAFFPKYGAKFDGIGSRYHCYLLAAECENPPEDWNRSHLAGYADYDDKTKVNGGTMTLRGKDLGEMSVYFGNNPGWPEIKVRGFDNPSTAEREVIEAQIVPGLLQFIAGNKAALYADACGRLRARIEKELSEARAELDTLEREANTAIAKL